MNDEIKDQLNTILKYSKRVMKEEFQRKRIKFDIGVILQRAKLESIVKLTLKETNNTGEQESGDKSRKVWSDISRKQKLRRSDTLFSLIEQFALEEKVSCGELCKFLQALD